MTHTLTRRLALAATLFSTLTLGLSGAALAQGGTQVRLQTSLGDIVLELNDIPVPMSEDYLGKIVGELTQNAMKFSQPKTSVKVSLTDAPDGVTLTVSDHGRGLSTEHITKIGAYMQFDRKLHEQQGLGLGLTICKRLTELHGGTLTIQSSPEAGTTVIVKLPKVNGG